MAGVFGDDHRHVAAGRDPAAVVVGFDLHPDRFFAQIKAVMRPRNACTRPAQQLIVQITVGRNGRTSASVDIEHSCQRELLRRRASAVALIQCDFIEESRRSFTRCESVVRQDRNQKIPIVGWAKECGVA